MWLIIASPARSQWLVSTSEPTSYPAQISRAGRDHVLCNHIIDGNNEAQSREGIHSLVSGRVWIRDNERSISPLAPVLWAHHGYFRLCCCRPA